jgi:signal transduction histidine kinase
LVVIERNVRAQTQLVDDLLDMSRIISGQMRFDVQPVMPYAFRTGGYRISSPGCGCAGVRLEAILDPAAGPVSADANRLQQIVWNLISNAIKFTPRGGHVQVTLERVNSNIEICVADSASASSRISFRTSSNAFVRPTLLRRARMVVSASAYRS